MSDGRACPDCGGEMWDNTAPGAKKNPKSPDYKCKDQACGKAVWLDKPKAGGAKSAPRQAPPVREPKWTWGALSLTYDRCLSLALKKLTEASREAKVPLTMADVSSAAATLFIAVSRDGVAPMEAAARRPAPVPVDYPEGLDEDEAPF